MSNNRETRRRRPLASCVLGAAVCLLASRALPSDQDAGGAPGGAPAPTLDETRVTMDKWIETQQIITREAKDWQQGKEILEGRLELVRNEVASLEEKNKEAGASVVEANRKRDQLLAENDQLVAVGQQLVDRITRLEADIRRLVKTLPDPIREKLLPLYQRIPEDPARTKVSAAERYQNVIGILNEVNKANTEITVAYEVHELAGGKPAEVQAMYVGLAQAYYVSAGGEAGIGRPTADGWTWEPSQAVAGNVMQALEIIQGKNSPAFVPLPVKLQ